MRKIICDVKISHLIKSISLAQLDHVTLDPIAFADIIHLKRKIKTVTGGGGDLVYGLWFMVPASKLRGCFLPKKKVTTYGTGIRAQTAPSVGL